MRLSKYLTLLTTPELEELKSLLNLTYDEEEVFDLLKKGSSRDSIADHLNVSPATVGNRITGINKKIEKLKNMKLLNLEVFVREPY